MPFSNLGQFFPLISAILPIAQRSEISGLPIFGPIFPIEPPDWILTSVNQCWHPKNLPIHSVAEASFSITLSLCA